MVIYLKDVGCCIDLMVTKIHDLDFIRHLSLFIIATYLLCGQRKDVEADQFSNHLKRKKTPEIFAHSSFVYFCVVYSRKYLLFGILEAIFC